jgi:hypothetical protein
VRFCRPFPTSAAALAALLVLGCLAAPQSSKRSPEAPKARVEKPIPPALREGARSFERFCGDWLSKLRKRQQTNERKLQFKKTGKSYVGEFTGYGQSALDCRATATGKPTTPLVGRIGYHEIRYRKSGATPASAKKSKPRELYRIEVTELFRFDGKAWVY